MSLEELKAKRALCKSAITRFESFLRRITNETIFQLKYRRTELNTVWTKLLSLQDEIEGLDPNEIEQREEMENKYFNLLVQADKITENEIMEENRSKIIAETSIKLPIITLPTFNGDVKTFNEFKDTFISLIHNNKTLNATQKMHYLKSCLADKAAAMIQSLPVTENNYVIAWESLVERYDCVRITVNSHIEQIMEIKYIIDEFHSLRYAIDIININLRSLSNLNVRVEYWDTILIYVICKKMSSELRLAWESTLSKNVLPSLQELINHMTYRSETLEVLDSSTCKTYKNNQPNKSKLTKQAYRANAVRAANDITIHCAICNEDHYTYKCNRLSGSSYDEKIKILIDKELCTNCLRPGHRKADCKSSGCKQCHKKHNTILHTDNDMNVNNATVRSNLNVQVLLATALVNIPDSKGKTHQARALLDSGSQVNLITERLASKLSYRKTPLPCVTIQGVTGQSKGALFSTEIPLKSRHSDFETKLNFIILQAISTTSQKISVKHDLKIPPGIEIADPDYLNGGTIDLIIGASTFWNLLTTNRISQRGLPTFQETAFGWIISGEFGPSSQCKSSNLSLSSNHCQVSDLTLDKDLRKFWEIEKCETSAREHTAEEEACEKHFKANYFRDDSGRFCVALPFKKDVNIHDVSQDSYEIASRRFFYLKNKLMKNEQLNSNYNTFMTEYEKLGHMTRSSSSTNNSIYLPHHAVLRDSSMSKIRVVFDASSKGRSGSSLNNLLMVGATIQPDLISIIMRFRVHQYVFTSDIVKMYRQILVKPEDRKYQTILWNSNNSGTNEYLLNTVTYGISSASFLAIRCLNQLALDESSQYPEASETMLNSFYVDDLLTGSHSIESTLKLRDDIITILRKGGFELSKWASNDPRLLPLGSEHSESSVSFEFSDTKTLGIKWNPGNDTFEYDIQIDADNRITKRNILSQIARIYDPLGLIGPVVLKAKAIMQTLWKCENVLWDDVVSDELAEIWTTFIHSLPEVNKIKIPRKLVTHNASAVELHGFCDASEIGYGASIYIKFTAQSKVNVNLICSKSRVAPIKSLSIPKLELCGAVLLAKLVKRVTETLSFKFINIHCWTDSTIVLAWLSSPPQRWKTFVANRVSEIQELTAECVWNHIASADNPADCLSRGLYAHEMNDNHLWFNGPAWLSADVTWQPQPPADFTQVDTSTFLEGKSKKITINIATFDLNLFERFSTLTKLVRVTSYCLRFIQNCKDGCNKTTGPLTTREHHSALRTLIKKIQNMEFLSDIENIQNHKQVSSRSSILSLHPFLDEHGIVRVGGRLHASTILTFEQKHPILLPNHHAFTKLVIRHYHETHLHAGLQATLAAIRAQYWLISARSQIRKIIRQCVKCFRAQPTEITHLMGNLPASRISPSKPFTHTGIDYAGPFLLREGKTRGKKIVKAYIALFVCFATKAIHLEIVSDLTTEAFIGTLRRFISRRGRCHHIYSDNATCFIGADRELKELHRLFSSQIHQTILQDVFNKEHITWHFAPPRSPHFNGLAEAGIKSAKYHMKRIAGKAPMTYEEMSTLVTQIEACLNSRPLSPISSDPTEFSVLTPAHFLIGDTLGTFPDPDLRELKITRLSRWQRVQQMTQHFWSRWSADYLHQLNQRSKWKIDQPEKIKLDTVVLIREDNLPPLQWTIGRVIDIIRGADGIARIASVKTNKGIVKRALVKLSALPLDSN